MIHHWWLIHKGDLNSWYRSLEGFVKRGNLRINESKSKVMKDDRRMNGINGKLLEEVECF